MKVWADGATTECAVVFEDGRTHRLPFLRRLTGNQGEYWALFYALILCPSLVSLDIFLDSQLVAYQVGGRYPCKSPKLLPMYKLVTEQITLRQDRGQWVSLHWIPREQNKAGLLLEGKVW